MRGTQYIDRALYLAKRSRFMYGTGAVIVQNNKVVGEGWSHDSAVRMTQLWSLHAEIHALGRCRHVDLNYAVAFVAGVKTATGREVGSQPCLTCAIALRSAGVSHVFYTDGTEDRGGYLLLDEDLRNLKVYEKRS